jgi:hopanoid biosynthesis associated radical SAM protein HpnH
MPEIVAGLVARKKYVYLCTNALLLEKHIEKYQPSKYLSFSIHMDGPREEHDEAVCRDGVYDIALKSMKLAISKGFRVTTNTTLFDNADPDRYRKFFDSMMELGVEGMMLSPGYSYEKAPDQEHFLRRNKTIRLFRRLLENPSPRWKFNQSPLFLEFLRGNFELECTPWGNPTYNLFGWQKPCYLLQDGYASSFEELMNSTEWKNYGRTSGNHNCQDCMVHCGYEPSAVNATFGTWKGFLATLRHTLFGMPKSVNSPLPPVEIDLQERESASPAALYQIDLPSPVSRKESVDVGPIGAETVGSEPRTEG